MESDETYMSLAMDAARSAADVGEVPIGAILVDRSGKVIATSGNTTILATDPTGHAEMNVLREGARKTGNHRLTGTSLYVTLEPCAMCAGAISHARVARLVIAAPDSKGGAVLHGPKFFEQPTCHWRPELVQGLFAKKAGEMLRAFFRDKRR